MESEIDINYCRASIGQRIRASREHLGLTRADLAVELGTSTNSISNYENGTSAPNLERFFLLCRVLRISADLLLGIDCPDYTVDEFRDLLRTRSLENPMHRGIREAILHAMHDLVEEYGLPPQP